MPLRNDVNADILAWLSGASFRLLNETWRSRGHGYPAEVVEDIAALLDKSDFDYEVLLRYVESRYLDDARDGFAQAYHGVYAWLAQIVSQILYRRQVERRDSYREGLQYFAGLAALAREQRPLWVFSLNHDVLVECIAALFGIEVRTGFPPREADLPCRNASGDIVAWLPADVLLDAELSDGRLWFFDDKQAGINLLKIRGALDVFTHGDEGRDLLRIRPRDDTFDAIIDALQIVNEGLLDPALAASLVPDAWSATNKIPYVDRDNRLQFLGRSLLASAARLLDPFPPLMQRRFLEYFRANMARVDRLAAVGYGFADDEINGIVLDWLEGAPGRALQVVSPATRRLPECLAAVRDQVELMPVSATLYWEQLA